MKNKVTCPICGQGHLTYHTEKIEAHYAGKTEKLDSHYALCDACGSEQAGADELRKNKRLMIAFRKRSLGLLTGEQVKKIRVQLGINQKEAAEIFGGGPVAFSKYENDDVMQSEAMDKLLRVVATLPDALEVLKNNVPFQTTPANRQVGSR